MLLLPLTTWAKPRIIALHGALAEMVMALGQEDINHRWALYEQLAMGYAAASGDGNGSPSGKASSSEVEA